MATFIGTAFDDTIIPGAVSPDVLTDPLLATPGPDADVIAGGDGNDLLDGGGGNDVLDGGDGNDTLSSGGGAGTLLGGDGDDRLLGYGDSLLGEAGDDYIWGGGVLDGGDGDDTLDGSDAYGGDGDDVIKSDVFNWVDGGAGVDTFEIVWDEYILGWLDMDLQEGKIYNTENSDPKFYGQFANMENVIVGGWSNDVISGSDADNFIDAGDASNYLRGGGGDDTLRSSGSGDSGLRGDAGDDVLIVYGGYGPEYGSGLYGGVGNDILRVRQYIDYYDSYYDSNYDILNGGGGADTMDGGGWHDLYVVENIGDVAAEGHDDEYGGDDTVWASVTHTLGFGIERLTLTGSAVIGGTGNALANTMRGNDADNRLAGLDGRDTIFGGAGADSLSGDAGDDSLLGGEGDDTLAGGSGDDVLLGGAGEDTASYAGAAGPVAVRLGVAGPQDSGGAGVDALVSVEHLEGSDFADTLAGTAGANRLEGGDGADLLSGGGGSDTLVGGLGADRLAGGFGPSDVFVIRSLAESAFAAPDVLAAESAAAAFAGAGAAAGDLIDVSAIDADAAQDGAQDFVFGTAPGVGRLWAVDDAATTDTLILGDVDGAGDPDFAIRIEDGAVLASAYTAADFVV